MKTGKTWAGLTSGFMPISQLSELSQVLQAWISFCFFRQTPKLCGTRLPNGVWLIRHNGTDPDAGSKSQKGSVDMFPHPYWWQIIEPEERKETPCPSPNSHLLKMGAF